MQLKVKTSRNRQVVDLTDQVNRQVVKSGIQQGACVLFIQHTTAALTVGEVGEGTEDDLLDVLTAMIPKIRFRHANDPDHAPAHMISSILGPSLTVPISGGRLVLGTWQSLLLVELDGPRDRSVHLEFLK
jgi:secondary thiamine-phosphate synthase enzyme